jgi:hypothetical protein
MKKLFLSFVLLFCFSGCGIVTVPLIIGAASAAAQGIIIWKGGEGSKYYDIDIDTVYRATKRAATNLSLKISDDSKDGDTYKLVIGEKEKMKIKIAPAEGELHITRLAIRVNTLGDKPYAEMFYKLVDENLNIIDYNKGKPTKHRILRRNRD